MATPPNSGPRLTCLGRGFILLLVAACLVIAAWFLVVRTGLVERWKQPVDAAPAAAPRADREATTASTGKRVRFGIAYGTEKQRWLRWALEQWAQTPVGAHADVQLIPMGSVEGAQALLAGDERINVWSPASSLYKDVFVQEWRAHHGKDPVVREESLALTPMVFAMWADRHAAFAKRYGEVSFKSLGRALGERGGWASIAERPEWGYFKFGHTLPNSSNSGLMALALMACEYHGKSRDLTMADILDVGFQEWLDGVERGVTGLSRSTGDQMKEMVLKGPSTFDVLFVYENVAIDYLGNAQGRWGDLQVAYPAYNAWNDNPYMIIDAPWSTQEQRDAAGEFLDFLMSEPVQREALAHGFRPGNPAVPVNGADSPLVRLAPHGLRVDVPLVCEPPRAEVVTNLLLGWQRQHGGP